MKTVQLFEDGDIVFRNGKYYRISFFRTPEIHSDNPGLDIYDVTYVAYELMIYMFDDGTIDKAELDKAVLHRLVYMPNNRRNSIEYVGRTLDDVKRHMNTGEDDETQIEAERPKTKAMWKVVKIGPDGYMESICCLGDRDEALEVARDYGKENTHRHTYYTVERVEAVVS